MLRNLKVIRPGNPGLLASPDKVDFHLKVSISLYQNILNLQAKL